MVLSPGFPLKKMIIGIRAAGFVAAIPVLSLLASPVLAADESLNDPEKLQKAFEDGRYLDWVPLEDLTEEQRKLVPNSCCKGAYVAPARTDDDINVLPQDAPTRAHADEQISEGQSKVQFKGNVAITQGNRTITTESATYDKEGDKAELRGGIQLRDPNATIRAESADIDVATGDAHFDDARFVLYESRLHGVAAELNKSGDNVVDLRNTIISSCEPGDNAWSLHGSEISLHPDEHYGTAKNMRITIEDIPVIYFPYLRFPVGDERLTGFLTPAPSYSERNGTELSVPFYWNIAPNADATLTPHYLSNRGFMMEYELRHLSKYFKTELNGSVINNDKGGYSSALEKQLRDGEITEAEAYPYRGSDRWYGKLEQQGGLGQNWSTNVDYSELSDKDYLRDLYNGSIDSNRQAFIRQTASIDYRSEHWFSGVKVDEFRLLTTRQLPYRELPRIHVDGNYQFTDWVLNLNNEYVNFAENRYFADAYLKNPDDLADPNWDPDVETQKARQSLVYGERFNTNYSLTWDKSFAWGFVKPGVAVRGLAYQLDNRTLREGVDDSPSFYTPQASIDAGLFLERDISLFGETFFQTLEPRAFYFYSDYRNQSSLYNLTPTNSPINFDLSDLTFNYNQLFRRTRFSGGDRLDDANQISLAVSTSFSSKETGVERLRLGIGQIFYKDERRVTTYDRNLADPNSSIVQDNTRSSSDFALQVSGQVNKRVRISADGAYDPRNDQFDSANLGFHYIDDAYRILNVTYHYTLKPVFASPSDPNPLPTASMNQLDTSFILPINSRWSIIARNNHDFTHGVELDVYAGLEYNDCCYRVRVVGRRWLRVDYSAQNFLENLTNDDFEPGIMFELELKGLGSIDKKITTLFEKTIEGFKERDKNLR
ncbi:MAG: LPS-assembly protein LptD [Gammaproteobacteria bacterium]|nr:MAG: LPS-assembly protein LptD [Gammaproteobacteria bacterium]